ncbi:MAG: DUF2079 domain-containing protein, partial [Chlamydiota bacterium]|nr:DUF2079 domain-containing protein [Chlamydiota bacterium]
IGLISLLCIKEDAFLVPIFFGAYAILYLKERKWGIISILIGIVWAFIVIGTVMPAVFPHDEVYRHVANRYGLLGNTHSEILKQVFFSPVETIKIIFDHDILRTLLYLFIPLACIPLISLRGILLMGPFLAQMLLSSWKYTRTLYFYYPFAVYPIVIIALILGLERIMKNFPNRKKLYLWLGYFLICSNLFFNFFFKTHIQSNIAWHDYYYLHESPLGYHFNPIYYKVSEHNRLAHRFIKEHIPPGVPLSVPVRFAAHLSNRQIIRMFPNTNGVDYVFLDLYGLPFAMRDGDNKKCVLEFLAEGSFGVIAENDGYILAKKGADTSINNNIIKRELWRFEAESLPHKDCGRNVIDAGNKVHLARVASPYYDIAGFLVYGPYIPLKAGKYTVMFSLKTSESKNDTEIAVLKITANHGRNLIAEKKILYQDFNAPKQYQQFFLDFELTAEEKIEFPVVYMGNTSLWLDYIQLMEQTLRVDES